MQEIRKKVHDKLLAVRNSIPQRKMRRYYSVIHLANEVALDLAFAVGDGRLSDKFVQSFLEESRAEIQCNLLRKADTALKANFEKFGYERAKWLFQSEEARLLEKNSYRLTMEEILEEYGIEHHYICGKKIYPDDVFYARFLNEHGLGHRKGAEITENDLSSIEGYDVFARREILIRAASGLPLN